MLIMLYYILPITCACSLFYSITEERRNIYETIKENESKQKVFTEKTYATKLLFITSLSPSINLPEKVEDSLDEFKLTDELAKDIIERVIMLAKNEKEKQGENLFDKFFEKIKNKLNNLEIKMLEFEALIKMMDKSKANIGVKINFILFYYQRCQ